MTIDPSNGSPIGFIADPIFQVGGAAPLPPPPGATPAASSTISPAVAASSSSISPEASVLSQLDQIQQQSPAQYSQVAASIGTQLKADAAAAQKSGNTEQAKTLTQLATEFQSSAQTGQVPSAQVLQKALATHHGHHGHHMEAASSSTSAATSTPTATLLTTALSNAVSSMASGKTNS